MEKYSLIKQLLTTSDENKLIIRVMRLWKVVNLYNGTKISFDMVLMDEKGDQIHESIPYEMFKTVSDVIQEGAILHVENFKIAERAKSFRPIDYMYMISFDENAIFKPADGEIIFPPQKFTFLNFKDLSSKYNDKGDLIDVIRFWCKSGGIQSKNTKIGTTTLKDIHIVDNDGNLLKIAFWGEQIQQLPDIILGTETQNVIIVTSTYVSTHEEGYCLQSTQATKAYVNLDIAEVTTFRNRGSKQPEKKMMTPSRKRLNTVLEKKGVDDKKVIKDILSAIRNASSKDVYSCTATITKFHKTRGWYYISCQNCLKVVKWNVDGYKCFSCKGVVDQIERYKIQFEVEDDTGSMDVTVFTDIAEELIGYPFNSMIDVFNEGNGDEAVYELIEKNIVGKQINFNLKISDYNRKFPTSSLTATKIIKITPAESKKAECITEPPGDTAKTKDVDNEVVCDSRKTINLDSEAGADSRNMKGIDNQVVRDSRKSDQIHNEVARDCKNTQQTEHEVDTNSKMAKDLQNEVDSKKTPCVENQVLLNSKTIKPIENEVDAGTKRPKHMEDEVGSSNKKAKNIGRKAKHI